MSYGPHFSPKVEGVACRHAAASEAVVDVKAHATAEFEAYFLQPGRWPDDSEDNRVRCITDFTLYRLCFAHGAAAVDAFVIARTRCTARGCGLVHGGSASSLASIARATEEADGPREFREAALGWAARLTFEFLRIAGSTERRWPERARLEVSVRRNDAAWSGGTWRLFRPRAVAPRRCADPGPRCCGPHKLQLGRFLAILACGNRAGLAVVCRWSSSRAGLGSSS